MLLYELDGDMLVRPIVRCLALVDEKVVDKLLRVKIAVVFVVFDVFDLAQVARGVR